jgi:type IV secretory pathway VirB2 component (pilin)
MKIRREVIRRRLLSFRMVLLSFVSLMLAAPAFAQVAGSPWENAVGILQRAFTSTIARGLSLVAIVVSGLTFAFAPSRPTLGTR